MLLGYTVAKAYASPRLDSPNHFSPGGARRLGTRLVIPVVVVVVLVLGVVVGVGSTVTPVFGGPYSRFTCSLSLGDSSSFRWIPSGYPLPLIHSRGKLESREERRRRERKGEEIMFLSSVFSPLRHHMHQRLSTRLPSSSLLRRRESGTKVT